MRYEGAEGRKGPGDSRAPPPPRYAPAGPGRKGRAAACGGVGHRIGGLGPCTVRRACGSGGTLAIVSPHQ